MNRDHRRWEAGQRIFVEGFDFQVVQGRKLDRRGNPGHDLRLDVRDPKRGWCPVSMELGAFLTDFFYENEDALSPPEWNYSGGQFYMAYMRTATRVGWRKATEILHRARRASKQHKVSA